jgi:hypothetical protein
MESRLSHAVLWSLACMAANSLLGGTALAASASDLVGGWYGTNLGPANSTAAFTFLSDGTYLEAEDGNSALDPSGQSGIERGTYSWNASTGAFSSTTLVDTNGQWGLSHAGTLNISVSGDILSVDGGPTLTRVADANNPIVGSWYATNVGQPLSTLVFTFLSNGTYLQAEDGNSSLDPSGQSGMERGTYSWNASTGAFSSTTLIDTNGQWGLSHSLCPTVTVSGGTLSALCADVSNPTVFTTFTLTTAAVPEPVVAWLQLSGLLALIGLTRLSRRSKAAGN